MSGDGLSKFDRDHIGDIVAGYGTWFHADLLRLCAHADEQNLMRLALAFPETVQAYLLWREGFVPA